MRGLLKFLKGITPRFLIYREFINKRGTVDRRQVYYENNRNRYEIAVIMRAEVFKDQYSMVHSR